MSGHALRQIKCYFSFRSQESDKIAHVLRQAVLVQPPQADIEKVAFAETPAVSQKIAAKIQFWNFFLNGARPSLLLIHLKFRFLRDNRLLLLIVAKKTRHRTKMPSSADQQSRFDFAVDDPSIAVALDLADRSAFTHVRSRPAKQIFIKLTSPDAIADGLGIRHVYFCLTYSTDAKARNGLKRAPARIVFTIDFKSFNDERRDPSATNFVAWEAGLIQDHNAQPRGTQPPGA